MDKKPFPAHRSKMGLEYIEMLYEERLLNKETITDETEINELNKLVDEKKPLPDDVYSTCFNGERTFVRIINTAEDMTPEDIRLYYTLRQTKDIHTIRDWMIFFGIMAIIGIVSALIVLAQ